MGSGKTKNSFGRPLPGRRQPSSRKTGRPDRAQDQDRVPGQDRAPGQGMAPGRDRQHSSKRPSRAQGADKPDKYWRDERLDIREQDSEMLEGRNPVMEALRANRAINKLLIAKGEHEGSIKQIIAAAREKGIVVQEVERKKLDSLSQTGAHQGVIAFVAAKEYVEVDDILAAAAEKNEPPFIIILDGIMDANNLGSILRTADAVGAHGVIISKRRAIGLTAAVAKASAGAVEYVPVARVTNISQTIEQLKKRNIWIVGTDADARESFQESDLKGAVALVIGSEGEGVSRLVREKCDFTVNIPMVGRISSLNAAVAGAIIMYEIFRQRKR